MHYLDEQGCTHIDWRGTAWLILEAFWLPIAEVTQHWQYGAGARAHKMNRTDYLLEKVSMEHKQVTEDIKEVTDWLGIPNPNDEAEGDKT